MSTITTLLTFVDHHMQVRSVLRWQQPISLFVQLLRSLSLDETQTLCQEIVTRYPLKDGDNEEQLELLIWINGFVPGATDSLLPDLITQGYIYPGELYLGAGENAAQLLLAQFDGPDAWWDHLLKAAAWIGNADVQAQFQAWCQSPPDWRSELYILPEKYANVAGWELTADGGRRDLYFSTCYELVAVECDDPFQMSAEEEASLKELCGWCQKPLRRLLDLDLHDPRCSWISVEGERLCLSVCPDCCFYVTNYFEITLSGDCHWSPENGTKPHDIGDDDMEWPAEPLRVGASRKTPFEAARGFISSRSGLSQLGGHPEWVQDSDYPQCLSCRQTMMCLGQIAGEDWHDVVGGIIYIFICLPCKKAATSYQQT